MEFQRRGAPHFHILLGREYCKELHSTIAKRWSIILYKAIGLSEDDRGRLERQHNRKSVFEDIRLPDAPKRYILKYAHKTEQKTVPKSYRDCGRFWGASRDIKDSIPDGVVVDVTEEEYRAYLIANEYSIADADIIPKYVYKRREEQIKGK